jgi:serine/threonine-protein phosphatase PGAM5
MKSPLRRFAWALLLLQAPLAAETPPIAPAAAAPVAKAGGVHTLVLVRHGNYDVDDPKDERVGKGLLPLGIAQARLAGNRLRALPYRFDEILASPLTRARETAELISGELDGLAPKIEPGLAECTPPTRRADVMAEEKPEDLAACTVQLDRLAARLLVATPERDRRSLVVAHGNVIRYLVTKALAVDTTAWLGMSIGHASLTTITVDPKGMARVVSVGDVGHLPPPLRSGAFGDPERGLLMFDVPAR